MRVQKLIFTIMFICMCLLITSCEKGIFKFLHANINCSDLEQSIIFYENLGFTAVMASDSEVTAEFAEGLGFDVPYTLSYAQLIHKDGSLIDLIQWEVPYDDEAPYSNVNHLGIARITLQSTNLDADIGILEGKGVEFFSDPASIDRPFGTERFVCFKDPDGTIIEIVERGGSSSADGSDINITGFLSANINCSDIEQSRLFYEMLDFESESVMNVEEVGSPEVATALGVPEYHVVGSLMKLKKGPAINLLEWENPHDPEPPYEQLNHLGVPRIAIQTNDLDAEIARLKSLGVDTFFSEPKQPDGPIAFLKFVCFRDPDGTVIELVELFPGPF